MSRIKKALLLFTILSILFSFIISISFYIFFIKPKKDRVELKSFYEYDINFNWYNTNGSLPKLLGDYILFSGSNLTNMYMDGVSRAIYVNDEFELKVNVSFIINQNSDDWEDQFAIFLTDNIETYRGNEVGIVVVFSTPQPLLHFYIQKDKPFFTFKTYWKYNLDFGVEKNFLIEMKYYNGQVNFFMNNKFVDKKDIDLSNRNLHLVLTSHKIKSNIDTSNNFMKVYYLSFKNYGDKIIFKVLNLLIFSFSSFQSIFWARYFQLRFVEKKLKEKIKYYETLLLRRQINKETFDREVVSLKEKLKVIESKIF